MANQNVSQYHDAILNGTSDPIVVPRVKHNKDEFARWKGLYDTNHLRPREQRVGNRSGWDLVAGVEQIGGNLRRAPSNAASITISTGGESFEFYIFAEAQDRRGISRTPGAVSTGIRPTSHRTPQVKKWGKKHGPALRSYPVSSMIAPAPGKTP